MDEDLWQFALKAFLTLFVVVDPLGVAPSFIALTGELGNVEKRKTLGRALIIAFGVTVFSSLAADGCSPISASQCMPSRSAVESCCSLSHGRCCSDIVPDFKRRNAMRRVSWAKISRSFP
jgi:hypothetical protein